MTQNNLIKEQDRGINFSLKDQRDKTFELFEQSGKRILHSFHPLAWTAFCAGQMKRGQCRKITALNTVPVGISVDSMPCKKAWAESDPALQITPTSGYDRSALHLSQITSHLTGRVSFYGSAGTLRQAGKQS